MPDKRIIHHQVHKYKQQRNKLTPVVAAAYAPMSERRAQRIEVAQRLPYSADSGVGEPKNIH